MAIEDLLELSLAAMLPVYEGGNATRIIASDGTEEMDPRTCRTVLKNLARIYGIDLAATRKSYGRAINKRHAVPIPFGANLVLIPVKIREKPLGENDGTFGYVNFRDIRQVDGAGLRACRVALRCDKTIDILVSRDTVLEYMKNARLVESIYMGRHFQRMGALPGVSASGILSPVLFPPSMPGVLAETAGGDTMASSEPTYYAISQQLQDMLQEKGDKANCLLKSRSDRESPENYDDLMRSYLIDLLIRALLYRKNAEDKL